MKTDERLPFVWDYDISASTFLAILRGEETRGRLNRDWAAVRLLEYAPYREIVRHLGFRALMEGWPRWKPHIRSESRRRGMDFLVSYLSTHHPDLLKED